MEKKDTAAPEQLDHAEEILSKARANKKTLTGLAIGLIVVVAGVLVWLLVAQSGSRKADELVAQADAAANDSIAMTLYADAAKAGYKSGSRAKAELGIRLYQEGKYAEALEYLDDASLDDEIAAAGVYTLQGDCHVNLDQLDQALKCYSKAISTANGNPEIVPFVLIKEANIYRAQGKYADEAEAYKAIIEDYPKYVASTRVDIKKYYERALAQSRAE